MDALPKMPGQNRLQRIPEFDQRFLARQQARDVLEVLPRRLFQLLVGGVAERVPKDL
jgi:hypothetical protein